MAFRVETPRSLLPREQIGAVMKNERAYASNFLNKLSFSVRSNLMF